MISKNTGGNRTSSEGRRREKQKNPTILCSLKSTALLCSRKCKTWDLSYITSLNPFLYRPQALLQWKKTQTECTSFNPNMYFLYYTWMSISQISSSSKWDRWETLPPAESQSLSEIQSLGPNKGDSNSPVLVSNQQSVVIKQRTQNDPTKSVFFYSNCTSWNSTQAAPQPGLKNSAPEFHPRPQLSNRL